MSTKQLFLPLTLLIALILRLPSLFEPNWYGDEGIYQTIGMAMSQGRLLYEGIWDNKPPLLYVIYAVFSGDQFWVRLSSMAVMLITIIAFYKLAKKLFTNVQIVRIITVVFALLFAPPFLEGNIANSENFMMLPIVLSMLVVLQLFGKKPDYIMYLFAGLLLGIAFLIKIVAIFDLATLLVFLFIIRFQKDLQKWFKESLLIAVGFTTPIVLTVFYFFQLGVLLDFVTATFSQNVTYVSTGNRLFFGQGLLFVKLLILLLFCTAVFLKRKSLTKEYVFIYLWFFFSIFNAFFGGRPWIHYLLTLLPAFCLFIGIIFENTKLRFLNLALCALLLFLIAKNFWIYGKTVAYYGNFIGFILGTKTGANYLNFFDWYVERDYEIASYIRENSLPSDTIFIWGDNAQIYALSRRLPVGRYTVAYHVTFYPNALRKTKEAIKKHKPPFIVVIRDDFPKELIGIDYALRREIQGAKVYKELSL